MIDDELMKDLLNDMEELAYRHCWRCDPDDHEIKRVIIELCDQQLWWFCPDCQTYYEEVDYDKLEQFNEELSHNRKEDC